MIKGLLGHSYHDMIEFAIFGEVRMTVSKTSTLGEILVCPGHLFTKSIGKQPLKTKEPRKAEHFKEEILKVRLQAINTKKCVCYLVSQTMIFFFPCRSENLLISLTLLILQDDGLIISCN